MKYTLDQVKQIRNNQIVLPDDQEYQIYLDCADDGNGLDITTGKPLKTYDEWLNS